MSCLWSCQNICGAYILGSIFIRFGTKLGIIVGIPMTGTNCALLIADLFYYFFCCKARDFMCPPSDVHARKERV